MSDKRRLWWLWAIWGAAFVLLEGYAIATKERVVPTLSRTIWWIRERHWFWKVLVLVVTGWLVIHLGFGECALGVC
jgi:hypothetical protein